MNLDPEALRALGALVEKERTTPEYYPLSLNALTAACNQKSNRDPVMSLDEIAVERAVDRLRRAGLAMLAAEGGRVLKYAHNLAGKLQVQPAEIAVLAELLLRGPQTLGELRGRAERMHPFADVAAVEATLRRLMEREPPLVARLARLPGHKEPRYMQLLGGPPPSDNPAQADAPAPASGKPRATTPPDVTSPPSNEDRDERITRLEEEVRVLRAEIAELWKELRSLTMLGDPPPQSG